MIRSELLTALAQDSENASAFLQAVAGSAVCLATLVIVLVYKVGRCELDPSLKAPGLKL